MLQAMAASSAEKAAWPIAPAGSGQVTTIHQSQAAVLADSIANTARRPIPWTRNGRRFSATWTRSPAIIEN